MVGVAEYQLHLEYAITPFFPILEMDLHKMLFIPFACIASPVPQPHPRSAAVPNGVPGLALAKGNLVELAYTLKMQFLQNWAKKKKKKLFSPQISPDWAVCGCTAAQDTSQKNI